MSKLIYLVLGNLQEYSSATLGVDSKLRLLDEKGCNAAAMLQRLGFRRMEGARGVVRISQWAEEPYVSENALCFNLKYQNYKNPNESSKKIETIIDVHNYIIFVDSVYQFLSTKNSNPISVPISLRMSQHDLDLLVERYLKKDYYNYWFGFETKPINEANLGSIAHILRTIRNGGYYDKVICHFTNIRRETRSNPKEQKRPASDMLSPIAGANIVGVNREPLRRITSKANFPPPQHKARLFDKSSYYYIMTKEPHLYDKKRYTPQNAIRLKEEFVGQRSFPEE